MSIRRNGESQNKLSITTILKAEEGYWVEHYRGIHPGGKRCGSIHPFSQPERADAPAGPAYQFFPGQLKPLPKGRCPRKNQTASFSRRLEPGRKAYGRHGGGSESGTILVPVFPGERALRRPWLPSGQAMVPFWMRGRHGTSHLLERPGCIQLLLADGIYQGRRLLFPLRRARRPRIRWLEQGDSRRRILSRTESLPQRQRRWALGCLSEPYRDVSRNMRTCSQSPRRNSPFCFNGMVHDLGKSVPTAKSLLWHTSCSLSGSLIW